MIFPSNLWHRHVRTKAVRAEGKDFSDVLCFHRNEVLCFHRNRIVCFPRRDAVAKILYSLLFSWLTEHINGRVYPRNEALSISILDIYGFEVGLESRFHPPASLSRAS